MIPVVTPPPPVVIATTDESVPVSVPPPPIIPILTTEPTPQLLPAFLYNMQKQVLLTPASSTCKDFVSTADVVKVALTNIPLCASNSYIMKPEGVINRIALIPTQRCVNKKIYYHKTGTIRLIPHKPTSGQTRSSIPLIELNLPPYQNNKCPPYPSFNHKASPPHTTTPQSHQQNSTTIISRRHNLSGGIFPLPHRASFPSPTHPIITTTSLSSILQLKQSPLNPVHTPSQSQIFF